MAESINRGTQRNLLRTPGRVWRNTLSSGCDLIFPPVCARCGIPTGIGESDMFCTACLGQLLGDQRERCVRCCGVLPAFAESCARCANSGRLPFSAATCIGAYERELREAVHRSKRPAEFPLVAALSSLLFELRSEQFADWRIDAVVAMPMHWMRRLIRGVNGPQLVAERLAKLLCVSEWSNVLARRRNTPPQASLPPSARVANVRGAFRVRRQRAISGRRLLLVDDVMTTGATCQEAAKTLLKFGATEVFVAIIARSDS